MVQNHINILAIYVYVSNTTRCLIIVSNTTNTFGHKISFFIFHPISETPDKIQIRVGKSQKRCLDIKYQFNISSSEIFASGQQNDISTF